jgi:hypothetical protein
MRIRKIRPKFLFDNAGKCIAVQIDIKVYEALLEELEDARDVKDAERIMAKKGKMHTLKEIEKFF